MRKSRIDWKDIASSYYPKALSLAILMTLFTFLVSPKMEVKPYQHKEIKVQAIEVPPDVREIIKPPETQPTPQIKPVIIADDSESDDDEDIEVVDTIPETTLDTSKELNAPKAKVPAKFFIAEKMPVPIKRVAPNYPESVKKLGIEGTVWLQCVVNEKGEVTKVEVKQSVFSTLDEEAIKALKQWKFQPAENNGKPVAVWVTLPFEFILH